MGSPLQGHGERGNAGSLTTAASGDGWGAGHDRGADCGAAREEGGDDPRAMGGASSGRLQHARTADLQVRIPTPSPATLPARHSASCSRPGRRESSTINRPPTLPCGLKLAASSRTPLTTEDDARGQVLFR